MVSDASNNQLNKHAPEFIKMKFVSQNGNQIYFRVKTSTKLGKVKESYYDRVGETNMRFVFEGQEINDEDTPHSLEMEEDDVIDVFQEQGGRIATVEYLTQGPSTPPPPKRKREDNITDIHETIRNLEKVQKRELAEIERKKEKDEDMFAIKKRKYLEAKCKLKEDFAKEVAERKKFQEKLAAEEASLVRKQRGIIWQASLVKRESARLEALVRGEEDRRLELECPVCMEEMLPPVLVYGCSLSGHPVCGSCLPGLTSCPTCRGPMGSTRAIGLEAVVKNLVTGP